MSGGKWIVFDLDGTLNQTDKVSVEAHRQTEREFGLPVRDEITVISTFGGKWEDMRRILAPGCTDEQTKAYIDRVAELERERLPRFGRAYDGCADMLRTLRANGWHTAVCSNSSVRYITSVLDALHLRELIDELRPSAPELTKEGTLRLLLEKVGAERAIMVGDRHYDREAAKANGIPFIGCLYGFAPEEMKEADRAVSSPREIPAAAAALFPRAARK